MSATVSGPDKGARRRLDAWKAIAQYLDRDVTTVRRWERREGLPVHRHLHEKLGSVYAYTDEIDAWWQQRATRLRAEAPPVTSARQPALDSPGGPLAALLLTVA
jgi:hypothetical protein